MSIDELHIRKVSDVDVEVTTSDQTITLGYEKKVMQDHVDMKMLTKWTFLTILFMIVLVICAYNIYNYWGFRSKINAAINTEYKDLQQKRSNDAEVLGTFGVIDGDAGIYRIPLDAAIDSYVNEQNQP